MQGKVEICGINTARREILKNDEMMELLRRTKQGDMAARERLLRQQQREPTVEQIAQELELPREEVVFAMDAMSAPVSLYEPVYADGGDAVCVMDRKEYDKIADLIHRAEGLRLNNICSSF